MIDLKTPREWEEVKGIRILDPDGWRGRNFKAFGAAISEEEFDQRMAMSTVDHRPRPPGVPTSAPTSHSVPDHEYRSTLDGDVPCQECGTKENPVWFTDSVFWNNVCTEDNPILCLPCFIQRAEAKGFQPTGWRVTPEWPWRRG